MRPPIASPWGDEAQPDLPPQTDEVSLSVGPYTTSFFASARLSIKSTFLSPAVWIMTLVSPIVWMLPLFLTGTGTWGAVAVLVTLHLFLIVAFVLFTMPIQVLVNWLRHRNAGSTTTTLRLESALDVSQIRTTELQWREVKRVVEWGSDVFILGSRKGILVPRETFDSLLQRDVFMRRANLLHGNEPNHGTGQ